MIDHVLACLTGHTGNLIEPASAVPALELTLDVHRRLTQPHLAAPIVVGQIGSKLDQCA